MAASNENIGRMNARAYSLCGFLPCLLISLLVTGEVCFAQEATIMGRPFLSPEQKALFERKATVRKGDEQLVTELRQQLESVPAKDYEARRALLVQWNEENRKRIEAQAALTVALQKDEDQLLLTSTDGVESPLPFPIDETIREHRKLNLEITEHLRLAKDVYERRDLAKEWLTTNALRITTLIAAKKKADDMKVTPELPLLPIQENPDNLKYQPIGFEEMMRIKKANASASPEILREALHAAQKRIDEGR